MCSSRLGIPERSARQEEASTQVRDHAPSRKPSRSQLRSQSQSQSQSRSRRPSGRGRAAQAQVVGCTVGTSHSVAVPGPRAAKPAVVAGLVADTWIHRLER